MRVYDRSWGRISPPHVMGRDLWTRIHPWGCWGEAREPLPTSGAAASPPFHRSENVANLSKTLENADTPETIHSGGRTFVWKVAPGGATTFSKMIYQNSARGSVL